MFKDAGGDTNYQEPVVVPQKVYKADVVPSGSSTGASSGQSCFWVLNKRPTAMVLHEGGGPANPGSHGLVSWRPDSGKWQPSRYYPGFVTRQICMPNSALNAAETVSICGDVGYQNFKHSDGVVQQIIAARNSPESDPACIAGHVCPPGLR
ncbi:MAG TPA: hypothetical protein VHD31_01860 [Candidatus Paceibacterota bacterium]|nr:hypothetical protein [Candidatus Paceibacterota bacterium]